MQRVVGTGYREVIEAGFDLIPPGIRERLTHTHFLCGVDPAYVGLHKYGDTGDGRSYSETAHVAFGRWHMPHRSAADRITTVVLPVLVRPHTIVHELGHVLDEQLQFDHVAEPVTAYAQSNRLEAFAEAFTAWCMPTYAPWAPAIFEEDPDTPALFLSLAERRSP